MHRDLIGMAQRLYDTRSRSKRTLETLVDGEVGIYVCGITPYSPSHIGHARQAIAFDIIVRWLRKSGLKVNHITNFTDIDDKIIGRSTSGNYSFNFKKNLVFGYIKNELSNDELQSKNEFIEIHDNLSKIRERQNLMVF